MNDSSPPGALAWYSRSAAGACPPKSALVIMLCLSVLGIVPALVLWLSEDVSPIYYFGTVGLALLIGLLLDLALTHRRYRAWGGQWLCGDCREVFVPEARVIVPARIAAAISH